MSFTDHTNYSSIKKGNVPGSIPPQRASALLGQNVLPTDSDCIFFGTVVDTSTRWASANVAITGKTSSRLRTISCFFAGVHASKFGGASSCMPVQIGDIVIVYEMKGTNKGIILGVCPEQVNERYKDRKPFLNRMVWDPKSFDVFTDDTGQDPGILTGKDVMLSAQRWMNQDTFPGENLIHNDLGGSMGLLRTSATMGASALSRITSFFYDNLLRMRGHNLDLITSASHRHAREDRDGALSEEEALYMLSKEARWIGEYPRPRRLVTGGYIGDVNREYIIMHTGDDKQTGLSERYQDSSGMLVDRSVVGGGFIKSRGIGTPKRLRTPEDPAGAEDEMEVNQDFLKDFKWSTKQLDRSQQMRDAVAWIMNLQSHARMLSRRDKDDSTSSDWKVGGDAAGDWNDPVDPSSEGGNTGAGSYYREEVDMVDVSTKDETEQKKPKVIRVNDAWVFVLPDGTVTIRDGHASCITLHKGHIEMSASKDITLVAGRHINLKAGHDININARDSADITAGTQQVRIFSERGTFVHSENGPVMISSESPASHGDLSQPGEDLAMGGVIIKSANEFVVKCKTERLKADTVSHLERNYVYSSTIGRYNKVQSVEVWQVGLGLKPNYIQFTPAELRAVMPISTETNFLANLGGIYIWDKEVNYCSPPGEDWVSLRTWWPPVFENLDTDIMESVSLRNSKREACGVKPSMKKPKLPDKIDWNNITAWNAKDLEDLIFTFRTEPQYNVDGYAFSEKHWMREWTGATDWSTDARIFRTNMQGQSVEMMSFPGMSRWREEGLWKYEEMNVNQSTGEPLNRTGMKSEREDEDDDGWTIAPLVSMKRHP